jgi:hypothetical protein
VTAVEEAMTALRDEISHAPYLVTMVGAAIQDALPLLWEGGLNRPGLWTYDGSDVMGVVLPSFDDVERYVKGLPERPKAIAIRASREGTENGPAPVVVWAFDRQNLLAFEVAPTPRRMYSVTRLTSDGVPELVSWGRDFLR